MFLTFRPRGPPRPWRLSLWTTAEGPSGGRHTCRGWWALRVWSEPCHALHPAGLSLPAGAAPQPAAQRALSPNLFPSPRHRRRRPLLSGIPKRETPLIKVSNLVFLFALPSFAPVGAFPSHPRPAWGRLLPSSPPPAESPPTHGSSPAVRLTSRRTHSLIGFSFNRKRPAGGTCARGREREEQTPHGQALDGDDRASLHRVARERNRALVGVSAAPHARAPRTPDGGARAGETVRERGAFLETLRDSLSSSRGLRGEGELCVRRPRAFRSSRRLHVKERLLCCVPSITLPLRLRSWKRFLHFEALKIFLK